MWDDPDKAQDLLALGAGVVVRDQYPDQFLDAHIALFSARHDEGLDLRKPDVVAVGARAVPASPATRWWRRSRRAGPSQDIRRAHEHAVGQLDVFGVPTFIVGDDAVFVRLMSRPGGDAALARADHRGRARPLRDHARPQRVQVHQAVALSRGAAARHGRGRLQARASSLSSAKPRARSAASPDDGGHEVRRAGVGQLRDRRGDGLLVADEADVAPPPRPPPCPAWPCRRAGWGRWRRPR